MFSYVSVSLILPALLAGVQMLHFWNTFVLLGVLVKRLYALLHEEIRSQERGYSS